MDDQQTTELTDDQIVTAMPGSTGSVMATELDRDGTDGDATDGTDGDAGDADGTDAKDGTDGDAQDADGTDSTS